jgi:hypothetical protein
MSAQVKPESVDRLIELYCDWRTECSEVRAAYERFTDVPGDERALADVVYHATLDREESAADEYARQLMRVAQLAPALGNG